MDNAVNIIKNALSDIEYQQCVLFGSRARGDAGKHSDYDLLLIINEPHKPLEKYAIANKIRSFLAEHFINADVIVKSSDEVERYKHFSGSIVKNALSEGVRI